MICKELLFVVFVSSLLPVCFSTCVSFPTQCGCSAVPPILTQPKIVGGYTAQNNSWPWIVSIRKKEEDDTPTSPGFAFCTGALISSKYVLTAAHCFKTVTPSEVPNYFVVIGAVYRNDTNYPRYTIESIIKHENFNPETFENDITLLELTFHVDFNNPQYGFICLPMSDSMSYPDVPLVGVAAGWGLLNQSGEASYTLQQVQLPIISNTNESCQKVIHNTMIQLCAGYIEGGKDTCQGDSGGPLMISDPLSGTWVAAAITSYGYGCAEPDLPGVYTRVSMYIDWINTKMNSGVIESRASTQYNIFYTIIFTFYNFIFILFLIYK